ncbi:hypothetical protein ACFWA5_23495 [Streptomyces mirabilis]|uniref:hypothetical protein n=1 Tax=Streptomyces mirabilis TaxID=68239 RepID=UPI0036636ABB
MSEAARVAGFDLTPLRLFPMPNFLRLFPMPNFDDIEAAVLEQGVVWASSTAAPKTRRDRQRDTGQGRRPPGGFTPTPRLP